jgi:hypothetical protein
VLDDVSKHPPKSEHNHHYLAESPGHEKVLSVFYFSRAPEANGSHPEQIKRKHKNIRNMQSKHSFHPLQLISSVRCH